MSYRSIGTKMLLSLQSTALEIYWTVCLDIFLKDLFFASFFGKSENDLGHVSWDSNKRENRPQEMTGTSL